MRYRMLKTTIFLAALPLFGCRATARWNGSEALQAESIEMQVDRRGRRTEVEYHIAPEKVPAAVREAMDKLHPGGTAIEAEREYVGRKGYWEITKRIGGRTVEALFLPNGDLFEEEIEVPASQVPADVLQATRSRVGGEITTWEEIRDKDRRLFEYHAKAIRQGIKYKVMVGLDGRVRALVREVPAEIEVPVD